MNGARLAAAAVLAAGLAGCAQALTVEPAPYAADPDCARVMLAVPETVGGLPARATSSQATAAWGDEFAVIARCGVEPPGPTTDPCVSVEVSGGSVDWLVVDQDDAWVATTFGRSPALEVTVPQVRADEAVGDLLAELTPAAALAPTNGLECR